MALVVNNPTDATTWLAQNPRPNDGNALIVFAACGAINSVFDTCGLLDAQKLALIRQGVNTPAKLRLLGTNRKSVLENLKPVASLPVTRGGCEFGLDIVSNLTAASLYFEDRRNRGMALNPAEFTDATMATWLDVAIDAGSDDDTSDDEAVVKGPGKFRIDDFVTWKESLYLKLRAMKGAAKVPLYYVVREALPADHVYADDEERQIYETRQNGRAWNKDNKRVAKYILSLLQGTDGYEWVKEVNANNGQGVLQALLSHYEGAGYAHNTIERANQVIASLSYRNEYQLSWEVFSTKARKAYRQLKDNGVVIPLSEQLRVIRTKVNTNNLVFNSMAKSKLMYDPNSTHTLDFYLSEVSTIVTSEFPRTSLPSHQRGGGRGGRAGIYAVDGGRPDVSSEAEYHIETINGRDMCNGVDVTDRCRRYPPNEWSALPNSLRREIFRQKRARPQDGAGRGDGSRSDGRRQARRIAELEAELTELRSTVSSVTHEVPRDVTIQGSTTADGAEDTGTTTETTAAGGRGTQRSLGPPSGALTRSGRGGRGAGRS